MTSKTKKNVGNHSGLKDVKSGTTNLGYEYESLVPAFFALKLLEDRSINDFHFKLNPSSYEKFDDLILKIDRQNGRTEQFAFQLKHRQSGKLKHRQSGNEILEADFEFRRKGKGFNVDGYLEKHRNFPIDMQKSHKFVLFTNAKFQNVNKGHNYTVETVKIFPYKTLFNDAGDIYKIENRYFLISGQYSVDQLNDSIIQIFADTFHADVNVATCYMDFFGKLRKGSYENAEITRDEVILKLTQLLLGPHTIKIDFNKEKDEKQQLIESIFKTFDIMIIQDFEKKYIQRNWSYICPENQMKHDKETAKRYKTLSLNQNLTPLLRQQILCFFSEKPLFLRVKQDSAKTIYSVLKICRTTKNMKLKIVLVGKGIEKERLAQWKFFNNLTGLKSEDESIYSKIIDTFKISLQGRKAECIANLKREFDIDEFITAKEIFQLLTEELPIGKQVGSLPEPYIERCFSRTSFKVKYLREICDQNSVLVHCNGRSQLFRQFLEKEEPNLQIIDIEAYEQNPAKFEKHVLVLTNLPKINENNVPYYQLQRSLQNNFEWVESTKSPKISEVFNQQVTAICGPPGIGKTTMMNYLANACPLNYWVAIVSLRHLNQSFLNTNHGIEKILQTFLYEESENNNVNGIIDVFRKEKNIVFLFDGLDELTNDSTKGAINIMKELIEEGYKVCIFCNTHTSDTLKPEINLDYIHDIARLTKDEQIEYIRQSLKSTAMSESRIETIIKTIYTYYFGERTSMLTKPLYLYIVTEILRKEFDGNFENILNILNLTKMFSRFIEGKIQHILNKMGYKRKKNDLTSILNLFKHFYIKECQIGALKSCLEPEFFRLLNLKNDETFINQIKTDHDFFELIAGVKEDSIIFTHDSFAVYFVAKWFSENFKAIPNEMSLIFRGKYNRIRYFFNLKLAEDYPLHLAVLLGDVSTVKKLAEKHLNDLDAGGRNVLHLASSMFSAENTCDKFESGNSVDHQKILEYLLNLEINPLAQDKVFQWNCFQYAIASSSWYSLEKLSEKATLQPDYLDICENLQSLCQNCVIFGYINILTELIERKGLDYFNKLELELDKPLLHLAIENGHKKIVHLLINSLADFTRVDSHNKTALHEVAIWGPLEIAQLLLEKNLNLEARDSTGKTPLQFAAKMGHEDIVKFFVEHKANINTTDNLYKRTPLHKASYTGKTAVVKYLIDNGANVNLSDDKGKTALQRATEMGHYEVVYCLLENGADINVTDRDKKTMLHYAAFEGHKKIVKLLVNKEIDLFVENEDGKTALQISVEKGHTDIIKILEDACKTASRRDSLLNKKLNRLHEAARRGNLDEVRQLLDDGAKIEETDQNGETILHIASLEGHTDLVNYLLEQKASSAVFNQGGRFPLHLASTRGHVNIVKVLLGRGQDTASDKWGIIPLQKAAYKGHKNVVETFIDAGINPNFTGGEGGTALHSAARGGHIDLIYYLISKGAKIGLKNNSGKTCLHVAAQRGCTEAVEHIIKLTQNEEDIINVVDNRKRSALHWAAERGYTHMIKLLIEGDADCNLLDSNNQTPLSIAKNIVGREKIVDYLESCM